jgi:2-oxoglutarate dehydrogenase E2 component (dihydrolipoamide succinyltransferase)
MFNLETPFLGSMNKGGAMKQEIRVPRMGESITEAVIGSILKPSGSYVKVDEEILELETEKVNQVLYAPAEGVLQLTVKPQDKVEINQTVGYVDTEGKASPKESAPEKKAPPSSESRQGKEAFVAELKSSSPKEPLPFSKKPEAKRNEPRSETRQKLSKIRRVIAERLVEAQNNAAMLTTFNEVDVTQIILLRERYQELFTKEYQVKLGFMPFFIKASVLALTEFPEVNAYLDGEDLVYRNYFDISIAVSTERGLVVPVVRDCDHLSFAEMEQSVEQLSKSARQGTLTVDDLQGGGFTITNGGIYGSLFSTPILNSPQTAILGMHKIQKRPVAINDQVMIRPMMYLALTYDHRVIDGRAAVSFLGSIKQYLEDPMRLILEV